MVRVDDGSGGERRGGTSPSAGAPTPGSFEQQALESLDAVYTFLLSWTGDPVRAEKLALEVMVEARRVWAGLPAEQPPRVRVFWVVRRVLRSTGAWAGPPAGEAPVGGPEPGPAPAPPAGRGAEFWRLGILTGEDVGATLRTLPPEAREVLLLKTAAELGYADIAEVTGLPVDAVERQLFRIRHTLQHRFFHQVADRKRVGSDG